MSAMSDHIEQFINELLDKEDGAELKRNELAQYFGCAPSQINYVLTTRFSLERGYMIKSKRGGGGHITIMRINVDQDELLHSLTCDGIGEAISQAQARAFVARLRENGCISERESGIMLAACGQGRLALTCNGVRFQPTINLDAETCRGFARAYRRLAEAAGRRAPSLAERLPPA